MHAMRRDRGVALVLSALVMLVLMLFAALAVDIGTLTNERRRAQTTADAAALAGGGRLFAGEGRNAAIDEVIAVSYDNLEPDISLAQWRERWRSDCTDTPLPAGYTASAFSPCISFNAFDTRIRVVLPKLTVDATFAQVIGVDDLRTSAFAEAELVPTGFGRVLPFGVPGASGASTELCLKTGPAPDASPPCNGPQTGNFGSVDISLFGNPAFGTPEICGNASANLKLAANMILGTDHPLDEWNETPPDPLDPPTETIRDDHALCPDLGARPNAVWAQTGIGSALDPGLIAGTTLDTKALQGRLTLGPEADRTVRSGASQLDDRPLWEYIPTDPIAGAPASCQRSAFAGATATKAQLTTCINDYRTSGSTALVFDVDANTDGTPDILDTPRFGFVPRFIEPLFLTGTNRYLIAEFIPVFLQTTYFACNPGGCVGIFDPGEAGVGLPVAGNRRADAQTAFLLPRTMLPAQALASAPGATITRDLALRR